MRYTVVTFLLFVGMIFSCSKESNDPSQNGDPGSTLQNVVAPTDGIFNEFLEVSADTLVLDSLGFYFNDIRVTSIIPVAPNTVQFSVPRALEEVQSSFNIRYGSAQEIVHSNPFGMRPPEMISLSENMVTFRDTLTIYGNDFDRTQYTKAWVNDVSAEVLHSSRDSVQLVIPTELTNQNLTLTVMAQLQEDVLENELRLTEPEILDAPDQVRIGETITILGTNFNPNSQFGRVIINDEIETLIVSIGHEEMAIRVPYGPYKEFEIFSITYETAGMQAVYDSPIEIISEYILYSRENNTSLGTSFTFNGRIFTLQEEQSSTGGGPIYLWEFMVPTQNWRMVSTVALDYNEFSAHMDEASGRIYVYYHHRITNNFAVVDVLSETLTPLADFPGPAREYPAIIASGSSVFMGKGRSEYPHSYENDFFEYDTGTDQWVSLSTDMTMFHTYSEYQTFQGDMHLHANQFRLPGQTNATARTVLRFDPASKSFTEVYFSCNNTCTFPELLTYNNNFYEVNNVVFRNLVTNDYIIPEGPSFFIESSFISNGPDIFFYGVLNDSGPLPYIGVFRLKSSIFP